MTSQKETQLELFEPGAHLDWRQGRYQLESWSKHRFCFQCRFFSGYRLLERRGDCTLKQRVLPADPSVRAYGICDYFEKP